MERIGYGTISGFGMRIAAVPLVVFHRQCLGYVSIAGLVGNAVLGSAYVAIILFAAVRIADGLIMFILRIHPISLLGTVRSHGGCVRAACGPPALDRRLALGSLHPRTLFAARARVREHPRSLVQTGAGTPNISRATSLPSL